MDKVGHPAGPAAVAAAGSNGAAGQVHGGGSGNEQQLLSRIRQLEDMVRVLTGEGNGKH